ncbi:MAG: prohibitin family protein [Oscillospiraceae bacterium]|nr:prohibitin family protein [Oscillospiraceae bacterium]
MKEKVYTVNPKGKAGRIALGMFSGAISAVLLMGATTIVPAGNSGVVVTLGKVEATTMDEGFHLKIPFIQSVVNVNNQIQVYEVEAPAVSRDLQTVHSVIAVNFRVLSSKSAEIYHEIGNDYQAVVLTPAVQESVKSITAKYTAEELITERSTVGEQIKEQLNNKVMEYGIQIEKFNIVNFDFSSEFNSAIEQKQVAEQNLLKTETEQKEALVIAEAEAKKKVIAAEAEADAILKKAEAEADANQMLNDSLTEKVLKKKMLDVWDGALPKVTSGDSSSYMFDLGDVAGTAAGTGTITNEIG